MKPAPYITALRAPLLLLALTLPALGQLTTLIYDDQHGSIKPISPLLALPPSGTKVENGPLKYSETTFLPNLPGLTNEDYFSVIWTGWFDVTREGHGDYSFGTNSDDQSVVYLDLNDDGDFDDPGELVVDSSGWHPVLKMIGTVSLNRDAVRIAIGLSQSVGGRVMEFRFKKGAEIGFDSMSAMSGSSGHFFTTRPPGRTTSANLWSFGLPGTTAKGSGTNLVLTVPYGTDVTQLAPTYQMSALASCDKPSGSVQNFTTPQLYTVTSEDGTIINSYVITVRPTYRWSDLNSGNWSEPSHWASMQPASGSGYTVEFAELDVAGDISVALDSPRLIGNLVFGDTSPVESPGGWILHDNNNSANTLTLAGTMPSITVNSLGTGKDATISAQLTGTQGLVKLGSGILTLANSGNNYSGETRIMEGVLRLGGSAGKVGSGRVYNYATLDLDCQNSLTLSNTLISPGTIVKNGPGTVLLNGWVSAHGEVTVKGGTFAVDGNNRRNRLSFNPSHRVTVTNPGSVFEIRGLHALAIENYAMGFTINPGALLRVVSGGSTAIGATGQSHAQILELELNGGAVELAYSGTGTAWGGQSCIMRYGVSVKGDAMSTIRYGTGATDAIAGLGLTTAVNFDVADVTAGTDLLVSAQLEGGGFVKKGPGTMVSTGNNTCPNTTTVSEGILELSGNNSGATGGIVVDGGIARFNSLASINGSGRNLRINQAGTVQFGPTFGAIGIPYALARIDTASTGTVAADDYPATDFDFSAAGLTGISLGALGDVTYTGNLTPTNGHYRLGGGGGTLTMAQPLAADASLATINGNVRLQTASDFTGDIIVANGTLTFEDAAVAKFTVTDISANRISGSGSVDFNGDFQIETSAVNRSSGTWPLVEIAGFKSVTFGESFSIVGFIPTEDGTTWVRMQEGSKWSFSETSGLLTLASPSRQAFELWAADEALAGPDADPGATPYHDGISNLLKYAFNMNGAGPDVRVLTPGDGIEGLPCMIASRSNDATVLRLEFIRRKNSGLIYAPKQSNTLAQDSWSPMSGTQLVMDTTDPGWERVVLEQPFTASSPPTFLRVEVTLP